MRQLSLLFSCWLLILSACSSNTEDATTDGSSNEISTAKNLAPATVNDQNDTRERERLQNTQPDNQLPTLRIIGDNIWVRDAPKDGELVFTLDDGVECEVLQQGVQDFIRGYADYWYQIRHEGKVGYVFGSQTSLRQQQEAITQELDLPTPIPLREIGSDSLAGHQHHIYGPTYFIGWSDDFKLAYAIETFDAVLQTSIYVKDIRTNNATKVYESPMDEGRFDWVWQNYNSEIAEILKENGITAVESLPLSTPYNGRITLADGQSPYFGFYLSQQWSDCPEYGEPAIIRESGQVERDGHFVQDLFQKNIDCIFRTRATEPIGYLKYPHGDYVVLAIGRQSRGAEGQALSVELFAVDLNGF